MARVEAKTRGPGMVPFSIRPARTNISWLFLAVSLVPSISVPARITVKVAGDCGVAWPRAIPGHSKAIVIEEIKERRMENLPTARVAWRRLAQFPALFEMQRREFLKRITQTVGTATACGQPANGQSAAADPQSAAASEYLRSVNRC